MCKTDRYERNNNNMITHITNHYDSKWSSSIDILSQIYLSAIDATTFSKMMSMQFWNDNWLMNPMIFGFYSYRMCGFQFDETILCKSHDIISIWMNLH